MSKVKVYGADWCPLTTRSIEFLKKSGIPFEYINVEKDETASRWVKQQNGGKEKKPTIDIEGKILTEPDNSELQQALESQHLLPAD